MRLVVITPDYATEKNPDHFGFVHARLKEYQRYGFEVVVICTEVEAHNLNYIFDGILVKHCERNKLNKKLNEENPDLIIIHFLIAPNIPSLVSRKCLVFVHGFEAIGWYRRLFNHDLTYRSLKWNIKQRLFFHYFAVKNKQAKFVFVSEWMRKIASFDIHFKFINYEIIPNFIDSNLFTFEEKDNQLRRKVLVLRNFQSNKYANDISEKVINRMLEDDHFKNYSFAIYGTGSLFKQITSKIIKDKRVQIYNKMFQRSLVHNLHKDYGIFLCPTRQDAQGVSMCEAMSSGLVPITSNNTAIPEFVKHKFSGFLCDNKNIDSFVNSFLELELKPDLFIEISKNASTSIIEKCSYEKTIQKEIEIILELIKEKR